MRTTKTKSPDELFPYVLGITKRIIRIFIRLRHIMAQSIQQIKAYWNAQWEAALAQWSRFTRLRPPILCETRAEEEQEGLTQSFAMIRLTDQQVVIGLKQIAEKKLAPFGLEILAHEIGHHVFCPGDLTDHGKMLSRMKYALPMLEELAPMVGNLYADLLINDRLQRQGGLNMVGVFKTIATPPNNPLWAFYMRTYEILWQLETGAMGLAEVPSRIEGDARLAARLVRVYGKYWLEGAGRFAALCLPYLMEEKENNKTDGGKGIRQLLRGWTDLEQAGKNGWPDGLTDFDPDEARQSIHPIYDPLLNDGVKNENTTTLHKEPIDIIGGQKKIDRFRGPKEYGDLVREMGSSASTEEITIRYYRERAQPHLIPIPSVMQRSVKEKLPEGYQRWEIGSPLEKVDWFKSVIRSPFVVPGLTTVARVESEVGGKDPEKKPIDLYIGIDCSGSMPNPAYQLSYPTLAATILARSGIRVKAQIMACLSGEPGASVQTEGFIRDEQQILKLLTGYLGTGYAYGIFRLKEVIEKRKSNTTPCHILVITDQDIFSMLDDGRNGSEKGWDVAEKAAKVAGAGATFVLHMPYGWRDKDVERMKEIGWHVYRLYDWSELIAFARDFSHKLYAKLSP